HAHLGIIESITIDIEEARCTQHRFINRFNFKTARGEIQTQELAQLELIIFLLGDITNTGIPLRSADNFLRRITSVIYFKAAQTYIKTDTFDIGNRITKGNLAAVYVGAVRRNVV